MHIAHARKRDSEYPCKLYALGAADPLFGHSQGSRMHHREASHSHGHDSVTVPASFSLVDGTEPWFGPLEAPSDRNPLQPLAAPLHMRRPPHNARRPYDALGPHSDDEQLSPPVMRMSPQPAPFSREAQQPNGMRGARVQHQAAAERPAPRSEGCSDAMPRQLACERAQRVLTARDLAHAMDGVDQLQEQVRGGHQLQKGRAVRGPAAPSVYCVGGQPHARLGLHDHVREMTAMRAGCGGALRRAALRACGCGLPRRGIGGRC